ncbi:hypothetical protein GH733_018804 [Mirounga leonina]|nr:hypothetical protein GH733_018804 [Mirounga leonina]
MVAPWQRALTSQTTAAHGDQQDPRPHDLSSQKLEKTSQTTAHSALNHAFYLGTPSRRTVRIEDGYKNTQNGSHKAGEKKGHSAMNEALTGENAVDLHEHIRAVACPRTLKEIQKFARREVRTPDVHMDTRLNKAVWAKGIRKVPYRYQSSLVPFSRCPEPPYRINRY